MFLRRRLLNLFLLNIAASIQLNRRLQGSLVRYRATCGATREYAIYITYN